MYDIEFADISKTYPDGVIALDHLNLAIGAGELFSFVGPSGCGKTTALRILAGLEEPTAGRVRIGGVDVTRVETRNRDLGLITQTNPLMSHRTAGRNITFPLEVGFRARLEVDGRLDYEASTLGISHLLDRQPRTLSEGERRLVQLARAVIASPSTLLMDEPLRNLEDQVRLRVRSEILRAHRTRDLTTILVTASQHDAMAMSDRIGVLFDGVIHQVGSPGDVYERPATARVAAFFGEPAMNVLPARVRAGAGRRTIELLGQQVPMWSPDLDPYDGGSVLVGFRPDDVVLGGRAEDSIEVRVRTTEPVGRETYAETVTPDGVTINCTIPGHAPPVGTTLDVGVRPERLHLFDPATELAVLHPAGR